MTSSPSNPEALAALCRQVKALEDALRSGQLTETMVLEALQPGEDPHEPVSRMVAAYSVRLASPMPHTGAFRASLVHHTLAEIFSWLRPPRKTFSAVVVDDPQRWRVQPEHSQPLTMRLDQVVSARRWGVGLELPADAHAEVMTTLCRHSLSHLAGVIRDVGHIEDRLGAEGRSLDPVKAPGRGHDVERLICDVLNETHPIARHASLLEDFLERTDIRLKLPQLKRRKGARLQVSLMADPGQRQKARKLPGARQGIAVISPLAMAQRIFDGDTSASDVFWNALPQRPVRPEGLARVLQHLWMGALDKATADPRGPIAALAPALRATLREDAAQAAMASTRTMGRSKRRR
ncbi:MAG: hypothetical protein ACE366_31800 [Bradymonadia bacterium]